MKKQFFFKSDLRRDRNIRQFEEILDDFRVPSVTGPIQSGRAGLVERIYGDLKINSNFTSNCSNIPAPGCIPSERGNCLVWLPREGGSGVPPHFRWLLNILKIKENLIIP